MSMVNLNLGSFLDFILALAAFPLSLLVNHHTIIITMLLKASFLLLSLALGTSKVAADKTPVVISHQGPLYWALPIHIATVRGYWDELLLEPSFEVCK